MIDGSLVVRACKYLERTFHTILPVSAYAFIDFEDRREAEVMFYYIIINPYTPVHMQS